MRHTRTTWIALAVCMIMGWSQAQLYQTSWENPPFTPGGSVNGIEGWSNGLGSEVSHSITAEQVRTGS